MGRTVYLPIHEWLIFFVVIFAKDSMHGSWIHKGNDPVVLMNKAEFFLEGSLVPYPNNVYRSTKNVWPSASKEIQKKTAGPDIAWLL